jgi:hypothetical protein
LAKLLLAKILLAELLLAELLLTELLLSELLLAGLLLLLLGCHCNCCCCRCCWVAAPMLCVNPCSIIRLEENSYMYSSISIVNLGLISAALPARLFL